MTNRRAGKTNTRDPRNWRVGKKYKSRWRGNTNRFLRRTIKSALRKGNED